MRSHVLADQLVTLLPVLAAIGGAVAWWIRRSDRREAAMIEELRQQAKAAQERAADAEAEAERWSRRATAWYGQLRDHGITPIPVWGEDS